MLSKFKNFFKLNNTKKWLIVLFSAISAICLTVVGSIFLLDKTKFSSDYKNGAQVVLKYKSVSDGDSIENKTTIKEYSDDLVTRLEYLYPKSNYESFLDKDNSVQIKITNINSDKQLQEIKDAIIKKQGFYFYDTSKNDSNLSFNSIRENKLNNRLQNVSISANSASAKLFSEPPGIIASKEYMILTNLKELEEVVNANINDYVKAGNNLYKFLFINPEQLEAKKTKDNSAPKPILKTTKNGGKFDAAKFLVSVNKGEDFKLNGAEDKSITLKNEYYNYKDDYLKNTLLNLKYSSATYQSDIEALNFIKAKNSNNAYLYLLIAAGIILALITIFLLVNYGLLGSLVLIPLALLVFLALLMITVFHGDYDPLNILAIVVSTFFAIAINIPFLERIKREVKDGLNVDKAIFKSNNLTFKSSLISSLILIIISLFLFFVAGVEFQDFSAIIMLQFIFSFFLAFLLPRALIKLVSRSPILENNKKLLGIWLGKKDLELIAETREIDSRNSMLSSNSNRVPKINFTKTSKYVSIGFIALLGATLITFLSLFFVNKSALGSFNSSQLNINRTEIVINDVNNEGLTKNQIDAIKKELSQSNLENYTYKSQLTNLADKKYQFSIAVKDLNEVEYAKFRNSIANKFSVDIYRYSVINSETHQKMINSLYMILIFIVSMLVFIIFKYKYSATISLALASILAFCLFYAAFILLQIPLSPLFGALLIFALFINLFNNLLIVNRIKEKLKNLNLLELDKESLSKVINDAIKDSLMNLILINLILIVSLGILATFVGALMWFDVLILLISVFGSILIALFITPKVFCFFENLWIRRKRKTVLSDYWDTEKVKEQIFPGINDLY